MVKLKKRKLLFFIIFFLLLFGNILLALRPHSFENYFGQDFRIISVRDSIKIDNFVALPTDIVDTYTINPTSADYQRLISSLDSSKFICCFHTLNRTFFPKDFGEDIICILWPTASVYLCKNSSHLVVNGVVYHQTASFNLYNVCWEAINTA